MSTAPCPTISTPTCVNSSAALKSIPPAEIVVARPPQNPRFDEPLSGRYWQVGAGETLLRSRSLWDSTLALPHDQLSEGDPLSSDRGAGRKLLLVGNGGS